eukprot:gnl/MRDRNA2_/MRDRNA2_121444_c0_seq1.p1 gnl/MRDRNA2_/MRDRNA2_121444_c0~~gnl/MRDRNA2_/MRDRNA2_121444_c0_seq1.p1  ORF type:complete len:829 (+),score=154.00 gnl/MRDRNA2_/MRDRNA2_121444_c0_seq1:169-2655(+)
MQCMSAVILLLSYALQLAMSAQVALSVQDSTNKMVHKAIDKLFTRVLKDSTLRNTCLESTVLAKGPSHVAVPRSLSHALRPQINSNVMHVLPMASSQSMLPRQPLHVMHDVMRASHSPSESNNFVNTDGSTAPVGPGLLSSSVLELPPDLHVMCMGISIHDSDVSVREQVAIKMDDWVPAAQELVEFAQGVILEAAVLSTCNRFELYLTCKQSRMAEGEANVLRWLRGRSGLSERALRENVFVLKHADAVNHLLRVSAGLDSLVIGEGQILSQVSACHQAATGEGGQGGKILARLFNQAVQSGKQVRDKTGLARGAVSISSAAVEFAAERASKDLSKVLTDSTVAVVGAGAMARLLLVHLKSRGVRRVVVSSLNIGEGSRAAGLVDDFSADMIIVLRPLSKIYDVIATHDICFFATAAVEPIVKQSGLARTLASVPRSSPLLLIDICVPRNVQPEVDSMANVFSYNIDRLKDVVARNTEIRRGEIIKAEALLKSDVKQWLTWHMSLAAVPTLKRLRERAELMRQQQLRKHALEIDKLSEKQRKTLQKFTEGLVKGLMHQPMVQLNRPQTADEKRHTIEEFHRLFDLYECRDAKRMDEAVSLLELIGSMSFSDEKDVVDMLQGPKLPNLTTNNFTKYRIFTSARSDLQQDHSNDRLAALRVVDKLEYAITRATLQSSEDREKSVISIPNERTALRFQSLFPAEGLGTSVTGINKDFGTERQAQSLAPIARSLAEDAVGTVAKLHERAETIRQQKLSKQKKYLKSLTQAETKLVEQVSRGIVNSLMAGPTSHLMSNQTVDEKTSTLSSFASLFRVSVPSEMKSQKRTNKK